MDARWLIEWMRIGEDDWFCNGPVPADCGIVIIGSDEFRTPAVVKCDRTKPDERPYFRSHMMGKKPDDFWQRWWLPPGVHPLDVIERVKDESTLFEPEDTE